MFDEHLHAPAELAGGQIGEVGPLTVFMTIFFLPWRKVLGSGRTPGFRAGIATEHPNKVIPPSGETWEVE